MGITAVARHQAKAADRHRFGTSPTEIQALRFFALIPLRLPVPHGHQQELLGSFAEKRLPLLNGARRTNSDFQLQLTQSFAGSSSRRSTGSDCRTACGDRCV